MRQYHDLLRYILEHGVDRNDRTWVGTRSIFWYQFRCDLSQWFPLLTTKKMFLKWIIYELLRFLSGQTNIKYLVDHDVHIRDDRPYAKYKQAMQVNGQTEILSKEEFIQKIKTDESFAQQWWDLGPVYGFQWRNFNGQGVDQITNAIRMIKEKPESRRIVVVAYNPAQVDDMLLPPCHALFQFYVANWKLSCQLYQRSCDVFLWLPFNIASYSLLTMMVAQVCDLTPGEFVRTGWDVHIYHNHFEQVKEQLSREPRPLPTMLINPHVKDIFSFTYEDFTLVWYDPRPPIKASIAV